MLADVVTIKMASTAFGVTEKALRRKIQRGVLAEGIHYHRHDGGIYIDVPAFTRLIRGQAGEKDVTKEQQRSRAQREKHQDRFFVSGQVVS